jgi:endoglucanase
MSPLAHCVCSAAVLAALASLGCAGEPGPPRTNGGTAGTGGEAPAGGAAATVPALPLRTESRWIVDANGRRFKLGGVNWYGAESATFTPGGLAFSDRHQIAKLVRTMGFNSVRIPWCNEMVATNPIVDPARVSANPDLVGKTALEVLDAVIDALAEEGLVIVLDNHRSRGDWCCDLAHGDGLWYTVEYPEEVFIAHWEFMARRYQMQPAVVGMDLRNELRGQLIASAPASCVGDCVTATDAVPAPECACEWASWGDTTGYNRDWTVVAERVGNAILAINPQLLILVEGPHWASWLGANYRPLVLEVANRLVYSAHNYRMSQTFTDCPSLWTSLDGRFGFVVAQGHNYTSPLWIGEFGIEHDGTDDAWWQCFTGYLAANDLDWAYWPLNGTQGPGYGRSDGGTEGYGVLDPTWGGPANADHLAQLQALVPPTTGP